MGSLTTEPNSPVRSSAVVTRTVTLSLGKAAEIPHTVVGVVDPLNTGAELNERDNRRSLSLVAR